MVTIYLFNPIKTKIMMYYLWKDKKSTKDKMLVYVTDYKEIDSVGKINVGGKGGNCYIDAELLFSSKIKMECVNKYIVTQNNNNNK